MHTYVDVVDSRCAGLGPGLERDVVAGRRLLGRLFADEDLLIRRHPRYPSSPSQKAPFGTRPRDNLRIELPINPSETVELFPIPFAVSFSAAL
jgi:hypothetical protein